MASLGFLPAAAQSAGDWYVGFSGAVDHPLDTVTNSSSGAQQSLYSFVGGGGSASLDFFATSWLSPFIQAGYSVFPYNGANYSLTGTEGDIGLGLDLRPFDHLGLRLDAMGGLAEASFHDEGSTSKSGSVYTAKGRLSLTYRILPETTLSLFGGYSMYLGGDLSTIMHAAEAGLALSMDTQVFSGQKPKVRVIEPKLDAVFPSLYAYYDENAFGTATIVNGENSAITNVRVSFYAGHYMDQPKLCVSYDRIGSGQSVAAPIKALFNDTVLRITQGSDAKAEIQVEYNFLGEARTVHAPIDFRMHHRNAITWSDDRRAAAFAAPTNPASQWFAKYAAGIVRDRLRPEVDKPLQYAMGVFEAERLYGLNYVVVPANDYSVKHGLKDYVDSVQFPHQTLSNRGGDCSDLAVLFSSLMESLGVEAAYITIPGHIFAAFDTGLKADEAGASFYDPGLLIFKDGKVWAPVEITMVKDGFIKAWRVGAKEWMDNSKRGTAAFYQVSECWKTYPPAAFPDVNPRFSLPSEADEALAFDGALDRFVARQMEPELNDMDLALAPQPQAVRDNELGVLYARYGMLRQSWTQFSSSAKAGVQSAWTNLANVAYLRKDYKLALQYYKYSYSLNKDDREALLGIARCDYELEDFEGADTAYELLDAEAPQIASKYGYLASIYGGQGRAWSLADRAASTDWISALKTPLVNSKGGLSPSVLALPPADEKTSGASASEQAAQEKQNALEAQVAAAKKDPSSLLVPASSAPPKVAAEAPKDFDLAAKTAAATDRKRQEAEAAAAAQKAADEAANQRRQAELAAKVAAQAEVASQTNASLQQGSANPPAIVADIPKDQDLAEKSRQAAAEAKSATAARQAADAAASADAAKKRDAETAARIAASAPAAGQSTLPVSTTRASLPETPTAAIAMTPSVPVPVATVASDTTSPTTAANEAVPATSAESLLKGFDNSLIFVGAWDVSGKGASQTDQNAFFGKLAFPLIQSGKAYRYRFTAKSTAQGRGWSGVGFNAYLPKTFTQKGYGGGDSICVWLTRDPVHYSGDITRLQLYRSTDDWNMDMLVDLPVKVSIYDEHSFDITVDQKAGTVSVSLDGKPLIDAKNINALKDGIYVALRSLDTAEFKDFEVESIQ